jgi:HTH-type transcriptional regulator/antitoxin HigA
MAKAAATEIESDVAFHPGGLLEEEIEVRGMTQTALAQAMGRPLKAINEIVRGKKAITAETAVQLEEVLGIPALFWLRQQARYDLFRARAAARH